MIININNNEENENNIKEILIEFERIFNSLNE